MNMKKVLLLLSSLFPLVAHSAVTSESFCFELSESSPVKFELRTFYDASSKWSGGFVKYAKSIEPISIVLTNTEEEMLGSDTPWQSATTWSEVVNGKVAGTYDFVTQGTQIVSMKYTKKSNRKVYHFLNNPNIDSSLESGCKWE
jgi:hypothetical protein